MTKSRFVGIVLFVISCTQAYTQDTAVVHPNTSGPGWTDLFKKDLSNAIVPAGTWIDSGGVFTATADVALWTLKSYDNFILDLDFKNADGTNSGVIVHSSDIQEWVSHSIEIQIADDYSKEWSKAPRNWQCAAIFGHQAATKRTVKKPGEWNHYTITCKGKIIWVALNGELVNRFDMNAYTSSSKNPDGTDVPAWLSNAPSTLFLHGHIGFQGKHADAPIYFRKIRIKELK
ncbi:MAG TPA: DUF1080 domain-containing protein [Puia sp.]|nr:DUF1080 domain-containing protein [Puia sp.]